MKVTLKNGTTLTAVSVSEDYSPRNTRGVAVSIRMNGDETVEDLRGMFEADGALGTLTIESDAGDVSTIEGYTVVDSIRKTYGGEFEFSTTVDLIKE